MKKLIALLFVGVLVASGCDVGDDKSDYKKVEDHAKGRHPYLPQNDVEFNNYNAAQRLYDSPDTIIWCTVFPENPSASIITIPIAGKLTSSSTTFFAPEGGIQVPGSDNGGVGPLRSVDGLYHPNPPQYRYGFTPGGQYVDFFNLSTFCTTSLTKFQREKTFVSVSNDAAAKAADDVAQDALKHGDKAGAQRALQDLESK